MPDVRPEPGGVQRDVAPVPADVRHADQVVAGQRERHVEQLGRKRADGGDEVVGRPELRNFLVHVENRRRPPIGFLRDVFMQV